MDIQASRKNALLLWAACTLALPLLWAMQFLQAAAGSARRSVNMAVALDQCANALLGGEPDMTISARTGLAAMAGKRWAELARPLIDGLFGAGHCIEEAREWMVAHGQNGA
jgi:hypothetical protein